MWQILRSAPPLSGRSPAAPSASARRSSYVSHCCPGRQRNGAAENVIGIVVPLGLDQPLGIAPIAFGHAVRVLLRRQKVRIAAGKRHRIEGPARSASPLLMSPLLERVRSIDNCSEYLDEHMVATQAEGRRLRGHARG